MVWPTWGRSFAVSGKMPQRNTRRARGKPVSPLRETLAAVPRPCSAASCEFGRDGRRRKTETVAGRERPPENDPRLYSRAFRRGRSLDLSLQEGRAARGPQRCRPKAYEPACDAPRVHGSIRSPVLGCRGSRLRRCSRIPFGEDKLGPALLHSHPMQPTIPLRAGARPLLAVSCVSENPPLSARLVTPECVPWVQPGGPYQLSIWDVDLQKLA